MYTDKEIKKAISHFKRVIAGLKYLDKASISDDSPYLKDYIKVRNERNRRRLRASRIAVEAIEEQTAKRGRYIEAKSGAMHVYPTGQKMCSVCNQRMPSKWEVMPPYCFGCGAKMDGGK